MTTDTDKIEELARWFDDAVYLVGNKDKAEFLRSLSIELTEWKIRCAELEQNAEHIQSSDEAEDLKRVLADCSAELTELRQVKEDADYYKWRLEEIIPLFQEARDALTAITVVQMKLHNISPSLADRMDVAGTRKP